jgi:hypothetical protein
MSHVGGWKLVALAFNGRWLVWILIAVIWFRVLKGRVVLSRPIMSNAP